MRYVLAAIVVCSIGAPAASALPARGPQSLSISEAGPIAQVAKRKQAPARSSRKSGSGANSGIHPLVGSGQY